MLYFRWREKIKKNFENERCKSEIKPFIGLLNIENEKGVPITNEENNRQVYFLQKKEIFKNRYI